MEVRDSKGVGAYVTDVLDIREVEVAKSTGGGGDKDGSGRDRRADAPLRGCDRNAQGVELVEIHWSESKIEKVSMKI